MKFVNVYLTDRAYGGPEEGGWRFPIRSFPVATLRRAERILKMAHRVVDHWNEGRSVLGEARYAAWIEDEPAAAGEQRVRRDRKDR